jgi:hypothetical protein
MIASQKWLLPFVPQCVSEQRAIVNCFTAKMSIIQPHFGAEAPQLVGERKNPITTDWGFKKNFQKSCKRGFCPEKTGEFALFSVNLFIKKRKLGLQFNFPAAAAFARPKNT